MKVKFIVTIDGNIEVDRKEVGAELDEAKVQLSVQHLNKLFTSHSIPC